jgi:hypothetical protein
MGRRRGRRKRRRLTKRSPCPRARLRLRPLRRLWRPPRRLGREHLPVLWTPAPVGPRSRRAWPMSCPPVGVDTLRRCCVPTATPCARGQLVTHVAFSDPPQCTPTHLSRTRKRVLINKHFTRAHVNTGGVADTRATTPPRERQVPSPPRAADASTTRPANQPRAGTRDGPWFFCLGWQSSPTTPPRPLGGHCAALRQPLAPAHHCDLPARCLPHCAPLLDAVLQARKRSRRHGSPYKPPPRHAPRALARASHDLQVRP